MADRHLFIWQRNLTIGLVAAVIALMAGFKLPVGQFVNQKIVTLKTLLVHQHNSDLSASQARAIVVQQDEAYQKVIATLLEQEKINRLNSPLPVQFQGKTIRSLPFDSTDKGKTQGEKLSPIALTFDDGPWPSITSQVLEILKKNNVKATFFLVGKQVQKYPQLVKQIINEGHAVGNHTWSHQYHLYDEAAAAHEIDDNAALIYKLTGVKTSLFRPPAGILNNGLVAYAQEKKYAAIMWSVDSKDWRNRSFTAQSLLKSVLKEAKPGGIILLHDGGGDRSSTVKALPELIAQLKKHGYNFVTVPELLEIADKELKGSKG